VDVAVLLNPNTGRLTFARNSQGDFYLDDRGIYPVFSTLFAQKAKYYWDSTVGTYLSTVRSDVRATGTRLTSVATDALEQCVADGLIRSGTAQADRIRLGVWMITMRWKAPSGDDVTPQPLRL
jgi:phage gp46-like protein